MGDNLNSGAAIVYGSHQGHSAIGYTADIAVSEDQFVLVQRVTQTATDNASLEPMVEAVEQNCNQKPFPQKPFIFLSDNNPGESS